MKLQDLRAYYRLREYQISHLINAKDFFKLCGKGKNFDQQLWLYLFYWADAMLEADEMLLKLSRSSAAMEARGFK